jgi:hypothetical protein
MLIPVYDASSIDTYTKKSISNIPVNFCYFNMKN